MWCETLEMGGVAFYDPLRVFFAFSFFLFFLISSVGYGMGQRSDVVHISNKGNDLMEAEINPL